jgi:menaquinone-specific isochorismate synthase
LELQPFTLVLVRTSEFHMDKSQLIGILENCLAHWEKYRGEVYFKQNLSSFPEELHYLKLGVSQIAYFSNVDNSFSITGLGHKRIYSSPKALDLVQKYIKQSPRSRFIGGLRFNQHSPMSEKWESFGEMTFVLPIVSITEQNDEVLLEVSFDCDSIDRATNLLKELSDNSSSYIRETNLLSNSSIINEKEEWLNLVNCGLETLKTTDLEKVVLAREKVIRGISGLPIQQFKEELDNPTSSNYSFYLQLNKNIAFSSSTPERLFSIEKNQIHSEALAGTALKDEEKKLLESKKNILEHDYVCQALEEALGECCESFEKSPRTLKKLKTLIHLNRKYKGTLKDQYSLKRLIDLIHPTPAVGGLPKSAAMKYIEDHEEFDRGFYAGPIGVIGPDFTEFTVGIRSAVYYRGEISLYAGAGIIKEGVAEVEWHETEAKLGSFQSLC